MVVAAKEKTLSDTCDDGIFGRWWACFTRKKLNNCVERAYLKSYQNVLKTYTESLPVDQQMQYQEMANEWSDRSPPEEAQQKLFFVNGHVCAY